jgi:hypothetical protein
MANNLLKDLQALPGRINDAMQRRINTVSDEVNRRPKTDKTRPIGSQSTLNGKPVVWGGESYGWQSRGSFEKLKKEGAFRVGQQTLQRVGNDVSTTAGKVWKDTPKPVREAVVSTAKAAKKELWDNQPKVVKDAVKGTLGTVDKGLEAVSKATNTSRYITDEAVTAVATLGVGAAIKHGGKATGRIAQALAKHTDDAIEAASKAHVVKPGTQTALTRQLQGRGITNKIRQRLEQNANVRFQQQAGAVNPSPLGRAATRAYNKALEAEAATDPYRSVFKGFAGKKRISPSSLPGQQPIQSRGVLKEIDEVYDFDVKRNAAVTPEARHSRLQRIADRRLGADRGAERTWDPFEDQANEIALGRADRPVAPVSRPDRLPRSAKGQPERRIEARLRRPIKGSPVNETEKRAYGQLIDQNKPRPLTAGERKKLTELNKQIEAHPRDYSLKYERERLIAIREGKPMDPRWQPGTIKGGSRNNAIQNIVDDMEAKASDRAIRDHKGKVVAGRRMRKGSDGRMSPYSKLEGGGRWWDGKETINADSRFITSKRERINATFNARQRDIKRHRQYEAVFEEKLPLSIDQIKDNYRKAFPDKVDPDGTINAPLDEIKRWAFWQREAEYQRRFGKFDEARYTPGTELKTDNAAGKESVKRQIKDALERRGHGDTRYRRNKPNKQDRIGRLLRDRKPDKGDKAVQAIEGRMRGNAPKPTTVSGQAQRKGTPQPRRFPSGESTRHSPTTQRNTNGRTVPVGRTVLDQVGQPQPKPKRGGRISERVNKRYKRMRDKIRERLNKKG